jgi:hypothetical protein
MKMYMIKLELYIYINLHLLNISILFHPTKYHNFHFLFMILLNRSLTHILIKLIRDSFLIY